MKDSNTNQVKFLSDILGNSRWNDISAFLDIETLGQKGGVPIHQVSALFPFSNRDLPPDYLTYYEAVPRPFEIEKTISNTRNNELLRNTRDQKRSLTIYENWSEAFDAKGRRQEKFFDYLGPYNFEGTERPYAFPIGREVKRDSKGIIPASITRTHNITPLKALSDIFDIMAKQDKKVLWIANANFEAGHFGAQLALQDYEVDKMIREENDRGINPELVDDGEGGLKPAPVKGDRLELLLKMREDIANREALYNKMAYTGRMNNQGRTSRKVGDFLYVNHPQVLKARATASVTNDWEPVLKSIEDLDTKSLKGITVMDPFDVIKGVTSKGSRVLDSMGLELDLKAVSRGISLELLGHAFYGVQEAHFGLEDNALTAQVLKTMFKTSDALSTIKEGATMASLNPEQTEAIDILRKLSQIKKVTAQPYAQGAVDRIIKDEYAAKVERREFAHATMGSYRTEWSLKDSDGGPGALRPKRELVPVSMSDWTLHHSPQEALGAIAKIPGNEDLNLQEFYDNRKKEIEADFKDPNDWKGRLKKIETISNLQSLKVREIVKKTDFSNGPVPQPKAPPLPPIQLAEGNPGVIDRWAGKDLVFYGPVLPDHLKEKAKVPTPSLLEEATGSTKALKEAVTSNVGKAGMALMAASFIYQMGRSIHDLENEAELPDLDYDTFGLRETPLDNEEIQPGMPEGGLNAVLRRETTDFGSPYRIEENQEDLPSFKTLAIRYVNSFQASMGETPVFFEGMKVDQRIIDFQMFSLNTPMKKQAIEAMMNKETIKSLSKTYFMGADETTKVEAGSLAAQGISFQRELRSFDVTNKSRLEVEDADTVIVHGGPDGQSASFRLSGIDAPEISHSGEAIESIRFEQNQPYGIAAQKRLQEIIDQAESVKIVFDPKQDTYGRALGVVMADGKNVNQQLVKEGWVKALPFGDVKNELIDRQAVAQAEDRAYASDMGIYQSDFWKTEKQLSSRHYRMTNNMLTRLDKLAGSNTLAAAFTIMDRRAEGEVVPNQAFKTAKRKLAAMGSKKKWSNGEPWKPNYYNNSFSILPEAQRYATPNYGISHKLELGQQKSTYLNTPTLIDSTTYSNSIYSYRKPQITRKFKNTSTQHEFHKMGQSVMTAKTQNANAMMGA